MFKEMRLKEREMDKAKAIELLSKCEYGTLATIGENGYCYAVPLNYIYYDNSVYFHCALEGNKLENINYNNLVSFCVVRNVEVLPKEFDTKYESAIVFGKAVEVNGDEKEKALLKIIEKYSLEFKKEGLEYINEHIKHTKVIKIIIDKISGKTSY